MKSENWPAYLCFLGLPALAIGFIAFCFYRASPGTGVSPVLAVLLGVVIGTVVVAAMITASGNDMADFAVTSLIVIVLTIIMVPVFMRSHENALRRTTRNAIRKALQEHGAIYPQPIEKGAQPNG